MNRLRDTLTGKRRKADRAQAQRIFNARREMDAAPGRHRHPGRESNSDIARTQSVWQRADALGSPRAKKRADRMWSRDAVAAERQQRKARTTKGRTR